MATETVNLINISIELIFINIYDCHLCPAGLVKRLTVELEFQFLFWLINRREVVQIMRSTHVYSVTYKQSQMKTDCCEWLHRQSLHKIARQYAKQGRIPGFLDAGIPVCAPKLDAKKYPK